MNQGCIFKILQNLEYPRPMLHRLLYDSLFGLGGAVNKAEEEEDLVCKLIYQNNDGACRAAPGFEWVCLRLL